MKKSWCCVYTAAIKHVSLAEQNPREAYRINVAGLLICWTQVLL